MRSLAFIPARGGSKRLPGKNIRLFNGIPLIAYTIAYAKHHQFDRIIVSTDDKEIAKVSLAYGAEVVDRPLELSSDSASTGAAAKHTLLASCDTGFMPEVFITLQPTNPLRPPHLYLQALAAFHSPCDSVISVGLNKHKFGLLQDGLYISQNYRLGERSQDIKQLYYESGLIYLTRPEVIMNEDVFGNRIRPIVHEEPYGMVDIDEEFDFLLGEKVHSLYKNEFTYLNTL